MYILGNYLMRQILNDRHDVLIYLRLCKYSEKYGKIDNYRTYQARCLSIASIFKSVMCDKSVLQLDNTPADP